MFTAPLPSNRSLPLRGADHIENTSTVLFTSYVCWTVYRTVAWQRVDQIFYSINVDSVARRQHRVLVDCYRCFGDPYCTHLQGKVTADTYGPVRPAP
jgi:hypothetical protein